MAASSVMDNSATSVKIKLASDLAAAKVLHSFPNCPLAPVTSMLSLLFKNEIGFTIFKCVMLFVLIGNNLFVGRNFPIDI